MFVLSIKGYSQCKDVYGKKSDCPTDQDSLTIYNNALKVYEYYEKNSKYEKTRTRNLSSESERRDIFEDLATARRLFFVIRRELGSLKPDQKRFAAGKPVDSYKDISYDQYYQEIDEYRFYQRELENQIVNMGAPASMFDTRISPVIVNEYHCIDSSDSHFGDLVNIPLYVPVTVKPVLLLTEEEIESRNSVLLSIDASYVPLQVKRPENEVPKIVSTYSDTPVASPVHKVINVSSRVQKYEEPHTQRVYAKCAFPIPIYAHNSISGTIVGFVCGRYFIKIQPDEYKHYAVPQWARDILENEKSLNDLLKNKFGEYLLGIQ